MGDILAVDRANKNISYNFFTHGDFMIGWLIGNVIWWVGLIVIGLWILERCSG